jgi:uncharacterized protein YbjT (DUF2867 family)
MKIAITGGTGTLGRAVAAELAGRGHEVRVLSRGAPQYRVDLSTGEGLAAALAGCDAVVDAANSPSARNAARVLADGSRRLLAAGQAAGVAHHVCVSIIGCERLPVGYYRVKAEQERIVAAGPVPWTIVRATQFHELVATALAAAGRWHVLPVPRAALQTVASAEVARAVADAVEAGPARRRISVAGPQVTDARELARVWRAATGTRAIRLPVWLPGRLGRGLRAGVLTDPRPDVRGVLSFADFVAARDARPAGRQPAGK